MAVRRSKIQSPGTSNRERDNPQDPGDEMIHLSGVTVSVEVFVVSPRLAVIVTGVAFNTEKVSILNVALLAPEGTVTFEGPTATEGSALVSETEIPSLGATPFSFTVPVELAPPTTEPGLSDSELNDGSVTVSVADFIEPPLLAVIVTGVEEETGAVVTLNVPFIAPAGIVMLVGTPATDALLDVSDTAIPLEYAGPVSVTVPVTVLPPTVEFGETLKDASA
jgi:hypothetical protein